MARGAKVGPTSVKVPSRPSFVMGSRPPNLYAPRVAPRPQGNIMAPAPRVKPLGGQRQYGKAPAATPLSGNTGLSDES